jgi:hypothetical protein
VALALAVFSGNTGKASATQTGDLPP